MKTMFKGLPEQSLKSEFKIYKRLLRYVFPYRWYMAGGLGFVALYSVTNPAVIAFMKPLLDGSFVERDPVFIFWAPIVLIVLFAIRGVAGYLNGITMNWITGHVVYDIQREMVDRMVTLPTRFYDENPPARLIVRISSDVGQLTGAASSVLITVVRESLTVIGLLAWIFILDWTLSLAVLLSVPFILALVHYVARRLRQLNRASMQMGTKFLRNLINVSSSHRLVKLYQTEKFESERLAGIANEDRRLKLKLAMASGLTTPITEFISATVTAGVVYLSLTRVMTDPLTVGEFVSFMAALAMISTSVKRLLGVNAMLQNGLAACERVFYLLDQESEQEIGDKTVNNKNFKGRATFKSVTYDYPNSKTSALKNLSLDIEPCQTVALVGESGSGKSTLTALLPRLYELQSGQVLIDDVDIREYKLSELRKLIAFVNQDVFLFNDTIAANIAYGNIANANDEKIREAAKSAYALDFIDNLPDGFDTLVGEKGILLSGGQKQRIAIARAFIKDARILILDEATSSLDVNSEYQVRKAVEALGKGRTVIVVAHRLPSIERVDRIFVMSEGRVVEEGTHEDLLERKGRYYDLCSVYEAA